MQVQENFSLKSLNTFGLEALARRYTVFQSREELQQVIKDESGRLPMLILGGGSNILFTKNVDRLVLRNDIRSVEKLSENDEQVLIRAGAGENWHELVQHTIRNNWAGLENLSLIPGCVGASPMQNIGAYGVEVKDVFFELEALNLASKEACTFNKQDCGFGYRESVFKAKYKDQFAITSVTFQLQKHPTFHTSYGAIEQELERMGVKELSIAAISETVIRIRSSKLPDPKQIGNAGSFFKNPSVPKAQYQSLKETHQHLVGYENSDGSIKLAAGWLIEHSGPADGLSWKGYRRGDAGVHEKQALVLVNYGNATGNEVYQLSEDILQSVNAKYGVVLEREVNLV